MEYISKCEDCLCRDCLENSNKNPNGCCYTCCKDSDECEPISQCPFGWYHDNYWFNQVGLDWLGDQLGIHIYDEEN